MTANSQDFRSEDRLKIQQALYTYCRAIDRIQLDLLDQVFHRDALIDRANTTITLEQFVTNVSARQPTLPTAFHMIGNVLIDFVDDDNAFVETYCLALERHNDSEKGAVDRSVRLRLGDHFQRREGQWKIARRLMIIDHEQAIPVSLMGDAMFYSDDNKGARDASDPVLAMRDQLLGVQ